MRGSLSSLCLFLSRCSLSGATAHTVPFCNISSSCREEPCLLFLAWHLRPGRVSLGWPWAASASELARPCYASWRRTTHLRGARRGLGGGRAGVLMTRGDTGLPARPHLFISPGRLSRLCGGTGVFVQLPRPRGNAPSHLGSRFLASRWGLCSRAGPSQVSGLQNTQAAVFSSHFMFGQGIVLNKKTEKQMGCGFQTLHLQHHDRNQESIHLMLRDLILHF